MSAVPKPLSPGADRAPLWALPLILVAAAGLRLYRLGSLPPAMFRDEAEKALNGWFLLQGGVDESGQPWPVFIKVFGVTTSAIYQYATIPFLAVGGLNEWTARLPAAVAGVLTVLFTWLLCRRVWGWQVAAWAAGLLAFSPWHIPLSRWAQQGVFLPMCFAAAAWGLACFLKSDEEALARSRAEGRNLRISAWWRSQGWLLVSAVSIGIAVYAYDPARLFAPLLALTALALWWRVWVRRWPLALIAVCIFLLTASPVVWLLATQTESAQVRFRFLSVFQPGVPVGDGLKAFALNYLSHFSPSFLLLNGDEELRHSASVGMLNFVELVFAVVGAAWAIRRRCRWGWFVILWVLFAPIAASLTRVGVPHALRSQVALPAWQILAGLGIVCTAQSLAAARQKTFQQAVLLCALIGALLFLVSYFGSYSARSAVNWQYGVKESLAFLNNPPTKDSEVYFHNVVGAEYLVPFYLKMNRVEHKKFLRGQTRYKLMPFQQPDRLPPPVQAPPAAYVSVPGYQWSPTLVPMPISAPGGEEMMPAMLVYMNPALMEKVQEQAKP